MVKPFFFTTDEEAGEARSLVPGKPLQYLQVMPESAQVEHLSVALLANI